MGAGGAGILEISLAFPATITSKLLYCVGQIHQGTKGTIQRANVELLTQH